MKLLAAAAALSVAYAQGTVKPVDPSAATKKCELTDTKCLIEKYGSSYVTNEDFKKLKAAEK